MATIICKICSSDSQRFDSTKILHKYDVNYYHCSVCGFVQTDEPHWLEEAYSEAISTMDTGIVVRNIENATNLCFFMRFIPNGICMDFGGGGGIFTRMMRDNGFDFYHYDKYAKNEFARGFEADLNKNYALITAFENFEHYVNPMEEIASLMKKADVLFFSTHLVASKPPLIENWWYYAPQTGQHIAFYSLETLQFIAQKHNCQLLSNNHNLHILSKIPIRKNFFKQLECYNKVREKLDITRKYKKASKTEDDFLVIKNANKGEL